MVEAFILGEPPTADVGDAKDFPENRYREKDETELYQELSQVAQGKGETPQSFVMQALDLR